MIDLKGILAISGHAGLYKVIAQAKSGVIVESVSDKKRMNAFAHFKMSSLEDISIFTTSDDMPLSEVFQKISDKEKGSKCIDGKASGAELTAYLNTVLPEFDKERVHNSDIKKLLNWYNILQENDLLKQLEAPKAEDTSAETTDAADGEEKAKKAKKAVDKTTVTKAKKDTTTKAKATAAPVRKTSTVRKTGA